MNENELFAAWRSADPENRADLEVELVKALRKHATALCWTFLGENVPEVVDTAVMQAILYSHNFRGDALFSTWFYHVVNNQCKSYLRKKIVARRREVALDEDGMYPAPASEPDFDVAREIERLAPLDQKIVALKKEGLSEQEIAQTLAINWRTVNRRWDRLKKKLSAALN